VSIFEFENGEYQNLLKTVQSRVEDLKRDTRIKYLSIFKNYGLNAGASQPHPHTQIVGMPILPIAKRELFLREFKYYRKHGRKLLQDIVNEEIAENQRVLFKSRDFISFMPYASIFPFEIIVAPLESFHSICNLNRLELEGLSLIVKKSIDLLHQELGEFDLNIEFGEPPINMAFDSEEFFSGIPKSHLFYIRIRPRIFNLGGFEISNGMFINPVEPEFMRKVLNEFL
jgi:UDPglucose--hexose-1-phosphate uridylyltransferase